MIFDLYRSKINIFIYLGQNWGDGAADPIPPPNDPNGAFNGFPLRCPRFEAHPEFSWPGRGNGTPISRREDFEGSINHISLTRSRDPNRPRGRDIDPVLYARIQDSENKKTCRYWL